MINYWLCVFLLFNGIIFSSHPTTNRVVRDISVQILQTPNESIFDYVDGDRGFFIEDELVSIEVTGPIDVINAVCIYNLFERCPQEQRESFNRQLLSVKRQIELINQELDPAHTRINCIRSIVLMGSISFWIDLINIRSSPTFEVHNRTVARLFKAAFTTQFPRLATQLGWNP